MREGPTPPAAPGDGCDLGALASEDSAAPGTSAGTAPGTSASGAVGVVILGMGRSGTSATARMFASAGFFAGHDDDLLTASESNPAGYWENLGTVRVNKEVLEKLGGSWFDPPPRAAQLAAREWAAPVLRAAVEKVLQQADGAPVVVKDPRIGVMMPLWAPVLADRLHPVLAIRDPVEIALSLGRHAGTPLAFALAAWELHTMLVLDHLDGRLVTVAPYGRLTQDSRLATSIVESAAAHIDPARTATLRPVAAAEAIECELHRNRAAASDHDEYLTPRQLELWRLLSSLPSGDQSIAAPTLRATDGAARSAVSAERARVLVKRERTQLARDLASERERAGRLAEALERERADRRADGLERERADRRAEGLEREQWRSAELRPESSGGKERGSSAVLGIGIATFDRRERLARLVAGLAEHTQSEFRLVVADDGSTDGSVEWCHENGLTVVAGRHHGVARNKNRALFALSALGCDPLILLEDDLVPTRAGWEREWVLATRRWHHLGYRHPKIAKHDLSGSGTAEDPILSRGWTAQCLSVSAHVMERVGYFDPRFEGWGHEHGDWTERIQRAGYGFREARLADGRVVKAQIYLWGGIALEDAPSYRDNTQVAANLELAERIAGEPIYRRPWIGPQARKEFLDEQVSAGIDGEQLAERVEASHAAAVAGGAGLDGEAVGPDLRPRRESVGLADRDR